MAYENEQPRHRLALLAFFVSSYPVTVAQFRAYVEDSGTAPASPEAAIRDGDWPDLRRVGVVFGWWSVCHPVLPDVRLLFCRRLHG